MPVTQLNAKHFVKRTNTFTSRRGGTLKLIDKALSEYERAAGNDDESVANLYLLIKCCDRYIKKSANKPPYKGMLEASSNELQQRRVNGATALRQMALNEMVRRAPAIGKGLVNFNARKARVGAMQGPSRALHEHYSGERSDYQARKVEANQAWAKGGANPSASGPSPFSGSSVHTRVNQYKEMGRGDLKRLSQEELDLATQIRQLEHVPDDVAIYRLLGNFSGGWKVTYLNKIKRMEYLMVPGPDGLFCDGNDQLVDMPDQYMYAMDRYGGLYAAPMANNDELEVILKKENRMGEYFNHSSFNAGKQVLCAGILLIKKGVLRYIDNNSGHYQPTEMDLVEALRSLQTDGVSLVDVGISTYKSRKGEIPEPYLEAESFVLDPTRPLAWSEKSKIAALGR